MNDDDYPTSTSTKLQQTAPFCAIKASKQTKLSLPISPGDLYKKSLFPDSIKYSFRFSCHVSCSDFARVLEGGIYVSSIHSVFEDNLC